MTTDRTTYRLSMPYGIIHILSPYDLDSGDLSRIQATLVGIEHPERYDSTANVGVDPVTGAVYLHLTYCMSWSSETPDRIRVEGLTYNADHFTPETEGAIVSPKILQEEIERLQSLLDNHADAFSGDA